MREQTSRSFSLRLRRDPLPYPLGWSPPVSADSRFLARAVLSYVLINAAVCGAFSSVSDRYQSRVTWLVVLVAIETVAYEGSAHVHRDQATAACA